ncbi:hypothetical protein, partial [uncultured Desulfovibrio sp.]|uniref:hypothetical protein n=1 Tax=uncultured Desulfovibrio sp. TaxID=167968 RepID=UPI002628ABCF
MSGFFPQNDRAYGLKCEAFHIEKAAWLALRKKVPLTGVPRQYEQESGDSLPVLPGDGGKKNGDGATVTPVVQPEHVQFEMLRISNHTACRFAEKAGFFRSL